MAGQAARWLFQGLEPVDHRFDLGARFFILGNEGGPFRHQGFLPLLKRLIFLAKLAALVQQIPELLLKSLEVFASLFQ